MTKTICFGLQIRPPPFSKAGARGDYPIRRLKPDYQPYVNILYTICNMKF
jgi:hypothetical protein